MNRFSNAFFSFANLFGRPRRRAFKASNVNESNVTQGIDWNGVYRDRYTYQRQTVLDEALLAWRLNPMARRIVNLQKQYVIDGIEWDCSSEPQATEGAAYSPLVEHSGDKGHWSSTPDSTKEFLTAFWNHPLNKIGSHLGEWADELALTGNLFVCITTDKAGMSYLRVYPTDQIAEIETAPNDVQQEVAYLTKPYSPPSGGAGGGQEPVRIQSYWSSSRPQTADHRPSTAHRPWSAVHRQPKTVMLHYAVNRLAGMKWGEPDIAPLLPWLARYASWLEDRVRLNRFRQAFFYMVRGKYNSPAEKAARQNQLNASPPGPGSILVTDESEDWSILNPQLDAFDANTDGLAVKKFIAAGMGYPLHWLAEPESSTRTTAEAAGTPTFKSLEERQKMFLSMLKEILQVVVERRVKATHESPLHAPTITVRAADISERDNAALALASTQIVSAFGQLVAGGFITADEYMRIVYRFAGETMPSDRPDAPRSGEPQASAEHSGDKRRRSNPSNKKQGVHIDSKSGEVDIDEPA